MADETVTVKYVYASWCGSCRQMHATINAVEADYGQNVVVERHEVQAEGMWLDGYYIESIPLIVVESETDAEYLTGVVSREEIDWTIHRQYGKMVDVYNVLMDNVNTIVCSRDIDKWPQTSLVLTKNFINLIEHQLGVTIINSQYPFEIGGHEVTVGESNQFVLPSGEQVALDLL